MNIKLVVVNGTKQNQVVTLRSEETIVGRQQGCDLRIPSPQVSRRHCRLSFLDNWLTVEDLASANGSFLNGAPVEGRQRVRPGDHLKIGPITFRVEYRLPVSPGRETPAKDGDLPLRKVRATSKSRKDADAVELADILEEADVETAEVLEDGEVEVEEAQEEEAEVLPVAEEDVTEGEGEGDEKTVKLGEDFVWRGPSSDELRDILSQMDKE
jgi:pSer/pThr/pTyr-binding forkhead associated (FHA) protein